MQVFIDLPREIEAKVVLKEKEGRIIIEPRFRAPDAKPPAFYVTVRGKNGAEKRFIASVSGTNGNISINEAREIETIFDRSESKPADKPADKPSGKAAATAPATEATS